MNLLVVNWLDRLNPRAGGAEIHLFEIFRRIAERGHRVRLICSMIAANTEYPTFEYFCSLPGVKSSGIFITRAMNSSRVTGSNSIPE